MDNFKSVDQLVDMRVVDFGQICSGLNVNELSTLRNMINVVTAELNVKLQSVLTTKFVNINMTDDEYTMFCSTIVSMGGFLSNLKSKLEVVEYFFQEKTPDCFKN